MFKSSQPLSAGRAKRSSCTRPSLLTSTCNNGALAIVCEILLFYPGTAVKQQL